MRLNLGPGDHPAPPPWLNLGPGDHPAPPPWLNLDVRAIPGVQLRADATALPFAAGAAEAIYAGHILEHVPLEELAAVLGEWRRVLRPGGTLMIVGPDLDRAIVQREPQHIIDSIVPGETPPPAGHAWSCSERVLLYLLRLYGWDAHPLPVAAVLMPTWPNPCPEAAWQCAISAC